MAKKLNLTQATLERSNRRLTARVRELEAYNEDLRTNLLGAEKKLEGYKGFCREFLACLAVCSKDKSSPTPEYWIKRMEILWR